MFDIVCANLISEVLTSILTQNVRHQSFRVFFVGKAKTDYFDVEKHTVVNCKITSLSESMPSRT